MTKLQKLIIGTTNIETRIRMYHYEARNSNFEFTPLHENSGDQRWRQRRSKLAT